MDWMTKLEECAIEFFYLAHDCEDQKLADQLKLMAAYLDGLAQEARGKRA